MAELEFESRSVHALSLYSKLLCQVAFLLRRLPFIQQLLNFVTINKIKAGYFILKIVSSKALSEKSRDYVKVKSQVKLSFREWWI